MKLYSSAFTPYPRRVKIYLLEKGITDIELCDVDLMQGEHRQPAYLAINPVGTVPSLEVEPGLLLHESNAIMEYLEECYPEPNMMGRTAVERARTRDMMNIVNDVCLYAFNRIVHISRIGSNILQQKADAASAMGARLQIMLGRLEAMVGEGPLLIGERPTCADCAFFACFQYLHLFYGEPLPEGYPRIDRAYRTFGARPSAAPPAYPENIVEIARQRVD